MVKLRHLDNTGTVHFVTFGCYHNYNLLKTQFAKQIFIKYLKSLKVKYGFKLYGYVIMPDHVHLLLLPRSGDRIGRIIGELKSQSAREILRFWRLKGYHICGRLKVTRDGKDKLAFWQPRFYDHNCRNRQIVLQKINYCHNNPVKAGLVSNPGQWPWSSYRYYHGLEGVKIDLDELNY